MSFHGGHYGLGFDIAEILGSITTKKLLTPRTGDININGYEKRFSQISFTEVLRGIGTWQARLSDVENIEGFVTTLIKRDGEEIFRGRVEGRTPELSMQGAYMPISGLEWTSKLNDYCSPNRTLTDVTVTEALTAILEDSPFTLGQIDDFLFIQDPFDYDTSIEFLQFTFNDTCIEYEASDEVNSKGRGGDLGIPGPEFRCCFWVDIDSFGNRINRFYFFYNSDPAGLGWLHYTSSTDGVTWEVPVNTGIQINARDWTVVWYDSPIAGVRQTYLFLQDIPAGFTDVYVGSINGAVANFPGAPTAANIFAGVGWLRAGPIFASDGHIFIIEETGGNGDIWESVNDGVAWNNRFTATQTAIYLLPKMAGGNIWVFEKDVPNLDLELWDWNGAAEAYNSKIEDYTNIKHFSGAQSKDGMMHICYTDDTGNNELFYNLRVEAGSADWPDSISLLDSADLLDHAFQISAIGSECAYVFYVEGGWWGVKIKEGVAGTPYDYTGDITIGATPQIQSPQSSLWDGEYAVFTIIRDTNSEFWFVLPDPTGMRLDRGQTTGHFQTDDYVASATFYKWGFLIVNDYVNSDLDWDIWCVLGSQWEALDISTPADLDEEGVPNAETTLQLKCDFNQTGASEPYVYSIHLSERALQRVTEFVLDRENCFNDVRRLSTFVDADFYLDSDNALNFVNLQGSDKTDFVLLKDGVNIEVVKYNINWHEYANALWIKGTDIEVAVKNHDAIAERASIEGGDGEHWDVVRDGDIKTVGAALTYGAMLLSKRSLSPLIHIDLDFMDLYDPSDISLGDSVALISENICGYYRINMISRTFTSEGEKVKATLVNKPIMSSYFDYMLEIRNLKRWTI